MRLRRQVHGVHRGAELEILHQIPHPVPAHHEVRQPRGVSGLLPPHQVLHWGSVWGGLWDHRFV